jgi:hypothetical protein
LVDDQKHYATILEYLKTGKYDISKPAPIVEWQRDKRKNITTNDLLNSGLEWERITVRFVTLQRCYFSLGIWEEYN